MLHNSKLIGETDKHYQIELPSGHKMELKKDGLHEKAHALIKKMKGAQSFPDGGPVAPEVPIGQIQNIPEALMTSAKQVPQTDFERNLETKISEQEAGNKPFTFANQTPSRQPTNDNEVQSDVGEQTTQATQQIPQAGHKLSALNKTYEAEKQAAEKGAALLGAQGAQEAKAIEETQKQIAAMPTQQEILQKYNDADQAMTKAYQEQKIDPDRYWSDKSTGQKIAAGIGMLLGGFGSVAGQGNMAADMIQKSIDRDIDAQKNDQSKTMNLWKMNREKMSNDMQASLATQNQLYNGLKYKIEAAAARFKGPLAQQNAQIALAQINQKQAENNYKMSLMDSGDGDPAMKVQYLVPPDRQKEVFNEIERAQNTRHMAKNIMESFEQAAKENTVLKTGAGMLRTPGSVYALHQHMQPTFQDLEGTVRQAAMDNTFKNVTPMPGDTDYTVQQKRQAIQQYLQSKMAAPTAKGYGIDLSKHIQTAPYEQQRTVERVTQNGKIALFDAETKKFLGYK